MSKPTISQIATTQKIPSLSAVALRLLEIAQQENPDFKEVSRILRTDPAISGKILKTVNSPLYGFRSKVGSIEQAVPKLGLSMIRTLILSFHLSDGVSPCAGTERLFRRLWRNSLTQAVIAELIAEKILADGATYFAAGMLQDIGIQAFATECLEEYQDHVLSIAKLPDTCHAEKAYFGFDHVDVTIAILTHWNLGQEFIEAVRRHHDYAYGHSREIPASRLSLALQAASMGSRILGTMHHTGRETKASLGGRMEAWAAFLCNELGLTTEAIEELIDEVFERVEEYSVLFNFDIDNTSPDEVTRKAKTMLQEIAVDLQMRLVESRRGQLEPEIEHQLYRDYLTELFNQRYLHEKVHDQVANWTAERKSVAILYIDVDDFKSINDTYGHRTGDDAIKHVSRWLTTNVRDQDTIVRLGGDEFLIVAQAAAERFDAIVTRLQQPIPPLPVGEDEIHLQLSIGCVFCNPAQGERIDLDWLIDQADQKMYAVKQNRKQTKDAIPTFPQLTTPNPSSLPTPE